MKFIRVLKANWSVEKINENDWTIKSPNGMYKDENGKEYHFKTKEDALEELDYLRAEHKFDKKSSEYERYTVEREDSGKSEIFEGERDRMFYIYDNELSQPYQDDFGEVYYFDTYEEAQEEADELNFEK